MMKENTAFVTGSGSRGLLCVKLPAASATAQDFGVREVSLG